jgi:septal ring factor EnvC (AmiA/AmiB activator)
VFKERKEQLDVEERKLDHAKAEVEGINETIRQMEAYDAQMKSDIAVTRRETYGVEEAISKAEKAKVAQDLFIDRMSEDFKAKSEELVLYEARLAAQRAEARQAAGTLAEAVKEMEVIQSEKKQLLMQWQSTLVAIQKRDEALQVGRVGLCVCRIVGARWHLCCMGSVGAQRA